MTTSLRIQELVRHIGRVYPQKKNKQNKKVDDLRKEESGLKDLFDIKPRQPIISVSPNITKPTKRHSCFVCSLQHVQISPDNYRRGAATTCLSNDLANHDCYTMDSLRAVYGGTFRFPVVDGHESSNKVVKRFKRERFKLPPVFNCQCHERGGRGGATGGKGGAKGGRGGVITSEVTRVGGAGGSKSGNMRTDTGRLLALASDKTFMNVTVDGQTQSNLISLSPDTFLYSYNKTHLIHKPVLPRIKDEEEDALRDNRRRFSSDQNMPRKQKFRKGSNMGSISNISLDGNSLYRGTLRYHHRQGSDIIFAPHNSFDMSFLNEDEITSTSSSPFLNEDSSVVYSRGSTLSETPNSLVACMISGSWCECTDVDVNRLRCSECLKIGGHHRWCVSKLGVCPSCGKAVKTTMDISGKINLARSPTFTMRSSNRSTINTDTSKGSWKKTPNSGFKVRFSSTNEIGSISPLYPKTGHEGLRSVYTAGHAGLVETKSEVDQKEQPVVGGKFMIRQRRLFDIDVHKKVYELALSDSRVHKLQKSKNMEHSLNNSISGVLFSYFPRWKQTTSKSVTGDLIGLKDPKANVKKIKRGMKHILGKIKIEDYYETIEKSTSNK